ncbi:MAG: hypothetical protein N4A74_00905 [Carboxylicivirga sp.]|nr:hypothetical protein [Carboxylicivirga sp.]
MKNSNLILLLICLSILVISCEKDNEKKTNFYEQEYRIGLWINQDATDTLEFTSSSTVNRKGQFYNEIYSYWINNETLFFSLNGWETSHEIIEADNNKVQIDNMYISIESTNKSGIFFKVN